MRLSTLRPQLRTFEGVPTDRFSEASSITFDCPGCAGTRYRHQIWAPFQGKGIPHPCWCAKGTGIEDLTFVDSPEGSRSIRVLSGCKSHFNVTNGAIDFYGDSGHTNPREQTMTEVQGPGDEQTQQSEDPVPVNPLAGFAKTHHLRFKAGKLQQRWDHGAGDEPPQWVDVEEASPEA